MPVLAADVGRGRIEEFERRSHLLLPSTQCRSGIPVISPLSNQAVLER